MAANMVVSEKLQDQTSLLSDVKEEMMSCYQNAVTLLQHNCREEAQYLSGRADGIRYVLEGLFDCEPEKENAGLKDLLAILEDL